MKATEMKELLEKYDRLANELQEAVDRTISVGYHADYDIYWLDSFDCEEANKRLRDFVLDDIRQRMHEIEEELGITS